MKRLLLLMILLAFLWPSTAIPADPIVTKGAQGAETAGPAPPQGSRRQR
jgi:hypothetical protein